jgi:hypothetical protein
MKTKIICLTAIILIAFTACLSKSKKDKNTDKPRLKKSDALITGNPIDYGMDNIIIFPVGSVYRPVEADDGRRDNDVKKMNSFKDNISFILNNHSSQYDRNAQREFINNDENKFDIRNILFHDLKTGKSFPLLTDTLHILSFAMHKEFRKPLIFYRIVKDDYNKDSIFNSQDAVILYISDIYGRGLMQVSPSTEQFVDYTYYGQTNTILIKSIIDSDKDKRFTNYDETNFREMNLDQPSMGKEIFKKTLKDSLRKQLKSK